MTNSFLYRSAELDSLKEAKNYYRWILNHFTPYLGERVIEVGAGTGNFSKLLLKTDVLKLILVEPAGDNSAFLEKSFSNDSRVQVVHGYLENLVKSSNTSANTMILVNVLEHIENDDVFLETARQYLVEGGNLLLFVPAMPWLYGSLDAIFGHHRRYTKSSLSQIFGRTGFNLIDLRYFNFLGMIPWALTGKLLERETISSRDVRLYDQWVIPWISKLEGVWNPPFGQSLLAIARK